MLPYFPQPSLHLFGGITIHLFGALVLTGVLLGNALARRRAREAGISQDDITDPILLALLFGFLGAHWVEILAYHPHRLAEGWFVLFQLWDGMSSFGGFAFGSAAVIIYYLKKGGPLLKHGDIYIQGLLLGFTFGRLGCTFAHDHPGQLTNFPLAFAYPDGPRHDLGFYEFLFLALVVVPLDFWLARRKPPAGAHLAVVALLYAPMRFMLDFLRVEDAEGGDVRWLGLTPAQYGCVATFVFAVWLARKVWRPARSR